MTPSALVSDGQEEGGGGETGRAQQRSRAEDGARFGAAASAEPGPPRQTPREPHPHEGEEGVRGGCLPHPAHTQTSMRRSGGPMAGSAEGKESAAMEAGDSKGKLEGAAAALARSSGARDGGSVATMEAAEGGGLCVFEAEHKSVPARPPFYNPTDSDHQESGLMPPSCTHTSQMPALKHVPGPGQTPHTNNRRYTAKPHQTRLLQVYPTHNQERDGDLAGGGGSF